MVPTRDALVADLDVAEEAGLCNACGNSFKLCNVVDLLLERATESDGRVVERSRAWCESVGTKYYRLTPQMTEKIDLDEICDAKLVELMYQTRQYLTENQDILDNIIDLLGL